MVNPIGLNKIYSIPKTKSVTHKKTEEASSGSHKNKDAPKKQEKKKRLGGNIDERC